MGETVPTTSASATTDSWRVDETEGKSKGVWMDRYRAVDSQGKTLEFLLSPTRDAEAAKRFFSQTLARLSYGLCACAHGGQERGLSQSLHRTENS